MMKTFRKQLWITTLVVTLMAAVALLAVLLLTSVVGHVAASGPAGPKLHGGSETEPNDTPAQANPILVNDSLAGQVPAANPSDTNYFVLTAEEGRSYKVRLDESPVSADYRCGLTLFDGNQNLMDEAETLGGSTSLDWTASTVTYFFRVDAVEIDTDDAPYDIRVVPLSVGPMCDVPGDYPTIQAAVDDATCETVNLGAGTFYESVTISRTVTLRGQGEDLTIVEGTNGGFIFDIHDSGVVTLTGMTQQNLQAGPGSAILNGGAAFMAECILSGNSSWIGGGIANWGTMMVTRSTLRANTQTGFPGGGGGIANWGTMTVTDSTLSGNSAASYSESDSGGGIHNVGTMTLINSTLSGNSADEGGGIGNWGTMTVINSTLSGNSGGIYNYDSGTAQVSNSIIADSANGADCSGSITSLGHNIDSDGSCGLTAPGDLPRTDALLGPLQDNDGPTLTHALLESSPAIDSGSDAECPARDQRGVVRPQDGDGDGVARCDIGAFELVREYLLVFLPLVER